MCGIPCSGKTTWIKKNIYSLYEKYNLPIIIISKDDIREANFFMPKYKYDTKSEEYVTKLFYKQLSNATTLLSQAVIIIDNTHIKPSRIDTYLSIFKTMIDNGNMKLYIKFFDIPLWRAKIRNIFRRYKTGKSISKDIFKKAYANYKNINKAKYSSYLYPKK